MLTMRPAASTDMAAVAAMINARCDWMEERGLPSWRPSLDDLVKQTVNPCGDVWVLELDRSRIVGRTTLQEQGPPWGWTDAELAEPALYLTTSVTDPAFRHLRPGSVLAWWAVDRAAQAGAAWVRRDCAFPELAKYYASQGYDLVREIERKSHRLFMMARRAERLDLAAVFTDRRQRPDAGRRLAGASRGIPRPTAVARSRRG